MVALCGTPLKAEVIRLTRLDICGNPVFGSGSAQLVSDGFTSVQNSPNYEDGQRFLQRKANGDACVNEIDDPLFNWLDQTVMFCTLDPDAIVIGTGADLVTTDIEGTPTATGAQWSKGLVRARFSMELWSRAAGNLACDPEGNAQYFYWAFPHVGGARLQQFTQQNDVFEFGWQGQTKDSSPLWDIGDPWMAGGTWGEQKHFGYNITTTPPPEPFCGAVEIVS